MITLGIQGGPGSFNEAAARAYITDNKVDAEIQYCFTSAGVVAALEDGKVEQGLMAIENSVGGVVYESIEALAAGRLEIAAYVDIVIAHSLLVAPGTGINDVETIISHPQALAQCQKTLEDHFPKMHKESGEGELVDQATAAKALSEGQLPESTAVLASEICAQLYDLDIVAKNLQDSDNNITKFLVIQ